MKKTGSAFKVKNFQHALELAKEFDLEGFYSFDAKYGSYFPLFAFFQHHFGSDGKKFEKGFSFVYPVDSSFFRGLDAVGKLPEEWKGYLKLKDKKNQLARMLVLLRSLPCSAGVEYLPRSILPSDTHSRPLNEQVEIIRKAYDWVLADIPITVLEDAIERRKLAIDRHPDYEVVLKDYPYLEPIYVKQIAMLQKFIAEKKRFMAGQQRLSHKKLLGEKSRAVKRRHLK